jgi:hypothetical protein
MTRTAAQPLTFKAKLALATFGVFSALAVSIAVLQVVPLGERGTEFDSIEDVRRAMMQPEQSDVGTSMEGGARASLRTIVRPHPNDSIIYTLKPELDLSFVRARVRTNSCGLRSPERPIIKPPGVYRIALLGDSFAFGWGVEQHETFAQKLEDSLNERAAGRVKFEVLNFGVPGYSTFQEVALFEELGLQFNPDAVLVYFVQNDFGMPFFIRDISGSGGGILSSMKFVQMAKQLLRPEQMDQQVQAMGLDPNHALKRLDTITSERGIKTFITINPRKSWKSDLSRLPAIRKSMSLQFIPLREGLLEYIKEAHIREEDLTLSFDPHPSPIRHNILGQLLSSYFLEVTP